jgi:hypothetical protein
VSFKGCYAVIDAWQRACAIRSDSLEWRLLIWLIRHTDDKTMTVIRSQDRLGEELGTSDRQVRTYLKMWRERGILIVVEHGGGQGRKPAKYRIDLTALEMYTLRRSERETPEVQEFRSSSRPEPCGSPKTSGVGGVTPEAHGVPEFDSVACTSGVEPELRKFEGGFTANSGSPWTSSSSEYSEKNSEEASSRGPAQPGARSLTRLPKGRLASGPEGTRRPNQEADNRNAILKLIATGAGDGDIEKQLHRRGVTVEQIARIRAEAAPTEDKVA